MTARPGKPTVDEAALAELAVFQVHAADADNRAVAQVRLRRGA